MEVFDHTKIGPIDLSDISPSKRYRVTVALGHRQRWRNSGPGGVWVKKASTETSDSTQATWVHQPKIFEAGVLSGDIVRGLVSAHNEWLKANRSREYVQGTDSRAPGLHKLRPVQDGDRGPLPKGDVNRMLLVVDCVETGDPLTERVRLSPEDSIRELVVGVVNALRETEKPSKSK